MQSKNIKVSTFTKWDKVLTKWLAAILSAALDFSQYLIPLGELSSNAYYTLPILAKLSFCSIREEVWWKWLRMTID